MYKKAAAILTLLILPLSVFATPAPQSMAALGDSMTAGVLAPYRRQQALLPWNHIRILGNTLQLLATGKRESLAFREYSWSTGHHLDSHYNRLKRMNSSLVNGNFAQPSAFSKDVLNQQIPALIGWSRKNLGKELPDYITLLVGNNDLCGQSMKDLTSPAIFQKNIHKSLQVLLSQKSEARILVVPIARIDALPESVGNSQVLPVKGFYHCWDVWKTIPLCRTVTQRDSYEDQKALKKRLFDFNSILKSEVRSARKSHGDRIRFASEMENYIPQPNDVAIDCFHPNKDAQKMIAQKTWNSSWWK